MNIPVIIMTALATTALAAADEVSISRLGATSLVVTAPDRSNDPAVMATLRVPMSIELKEASVEQFAEMLRLSTGANVVVDPALRARAPIITMTMRESDAATVVQWAARLGGFTYQARNEALFLTDQAAPVASKTVVYDVADLMPPRSFPAPFELALSDSSPAVTLLPTIPVPADTADQRMALIEQLIRTHVRY